MSLKLNALREADREFYGRSTEQIPKLIADGRVPMSVAGLMRRRLDVRNSDPIVRGFYMDNHFDTGDAIAYHPDGRVKIVLDSQHLRDMTPEAKLSDGALILTEDVYNALEGKEFNKRQLGKVAKRLSKDEVKYHPVWRALARDQTLLYDYADYIFTEGKKRFGYDTAMGVFPDFAGDNPKMGAWYVGWLKYGSNALGFLSYYRNGRFIGIEKHL